MQFYRCLMGEFKKRKRGPFLMLHVSIPLILPLALVMYFLSRNSPISWEVSYVVFFELIGVGTPVIISIICGMVADSEKEAGHFHNMLGVIQSKAISFISQTTMIVSSYCIALFLTILLYTLSLNLLPGMTDINFTLYFLTGIIFSVTSTFQYLLYQVIGYKYGIGSCSIWGFGGMMIAALSMTSIGNQVWAFLPWAWANRFSGYVNDYWQDATIENHTMLMTGGYCLVILTVGMLIISVVWINHWVGRKTND